MNKIYQIFGKKIKLSTLNSMEGDLLHKELSLYPVTNDSEFDLEINYVASIDTKKALSVNPSINFLMNDRVITKMGGCTVEFCFRDKKLSEVNFSINETSGVTRFVNKWKSMQFTSALEAIGQTFHELILIPIVFLIDDYSVVHSSGIKNKNDEVVLFGGTGGVGKTSLEMALCLERDYTFFNDDLAIIDGRGNCYPNFSYPKIYGYNIQGDKRLKSEILNESGIVNRLQYEYRNLKGLNKVRRRINPQEFFENTSNTKGKIASLLILFRSNVAEIKFESISAEKASSNNTGIMASEYNAFFDHVRWHEFNSSILNREPLLSFDSIMEKNTATLAKSLNEVKQIYLVHIPKEISNDVYKKQMVAELIKRDLI